MLRNDLLLYHSATSYNMKICCGMVTTNLVSIKLDFSPNFNNHWF